MELTDVVTLNVGGCLYSTTRSTLLAMRCREGGETYFHLLLKGNFKTTRDKDGNIFIDRDGEVFKYILRILRNQSWKGLGLSQDLAPLVRQEAEYFMLAPPVPSAEPVVPSDNDVLKYHLTLRDDSDEHWIQQNEGRWTKLVAVTQERFAAARSTAMKWTFATPLYYHPSSSTEVQREATRPGWKEFLGTNATLEVESLEMYEFLSQNHSKIVWLFKSRFSLTVSVVRLEFPPHSLIKITDMAKSSGLGLFNGTILHAVFIGT
jgi:hypothetical protein